jgi:DNA repair exonuclease SbcCD ATPase subunit
MEQAASQASQGQSSKASDSQQQAERALAEAARQLGAAAGERSSERDEEMQKRLKELKAAQEELQKRLKELEDLLKQTENDGAKKAARGANQAMEQTQSRLQQGDTVKGFEDAEEARKYLEEAKQELEKEQRKYESMQQEELLFRLVRDLKEIRAAEQALRSETAELVEEVARHRSQGGRLPRARRVRAKAMAGEQTALADKVDERLEAVKREQSSAFAAVLEEAGQDMREVSRLLDQPDDLGALALGLQDEVIHRINDLIGGFEDELGRRQKEPQQGGGGGQQQQQGKPPLVPMLVELKLLRRTQADLVTKVQRFWELHPDLDASNLTEAQRRAVERLFHAQGRMRRVFEDLVERFLRQPDGQDGN